jgi:hypothetical protein
MSWWWCLRHGAVEEGEGCPNKDRLGPYPSREQAESVITRTTERTEREDARDAEERKRWGGGLGDAVFGGGRDDRDDERDDERG